MTVTTLSPTGLALIQSYEKLRLSAYLCPSNKLTIGWGHVLQPRDYRPFRLTNARLGEIIKINERARKIVIPLKIDRSQADAWFAVDANDAATCLVSLAQTFVKPLTQPQFDAVASFIFNVGQGNYAQSTLKKLLQAGDFEGAAAQFDRWVYGTVNGKKTKLNGLIRRRAEERKLFESGGD